MPPPNDFRKLSPDEWEQLQERADRFAESLQKGMVPDWETFLADLTVRMRTLVLHELIKTDLDHRWKRGDKALLEEYTARFVELGTLANLPADLICEEYRIRLRRGDQPDLSHYQMRFPGQFGEVARALAKEVPPTLRSSHAGPAGDADAASIRMDASIGIPQESQKPNLDESAPGTYELGDKLGEGHFADVYRAAARGGIEVAVKVLKQPIDRDSAQRELHSLDLVKNLRHPCLLSTHTYYLEKSRLHIVMELADGSLRDRLKACRKQNQPGIPRDELLMYFGDAAEGLDFLHARKIFHRDIKPDNIMLLHGHAKVADFGLARLQQRQMMTVSFAGTPVYMAPEAWGGKGGPRSDQYSLAFAYAELRQGKRPIEGNDFTEVMSRTLEGEPDLSGIPADEVKVLKRALSKKPEERFATCTEFVAALAKSAGTPMRIRTHTEDELRREVGGDADSQTYKEPTNPDIDITGSWKKYALVAGLLIVLAGGGFGAWNYFFKGRTTTTGEQPPKQDDVKKDDPPKKDRFDEHMAAARAAFREKNFDEAIAHARDALVVRLDNPEAMQLIADAIDAKKPKTSPLWLPAKFAADPKAEVIDYGKKRLTKRIVYELKGGTEAFILHLPPDGRPFYLMENKVSNAFFEELYGKKGKGGFQPLIGVTIEEANQFALRLGGHLPTTKQWDFAAGFDDRRGRGGPYMVEGNVAVNRTEPRPVTHPDEDRGPTGVKDLAGNGREFTRDVISKKGKEVPIEAPAPDDLVILRGRNYTLQTPLTYASLAYEQKMPQTQFYLKGSPYTSFRVVIEVQE